MTKHPLLTGQSFFSGERAARIASTKANYLYAENIFKNASRNIWDDYENTVSKITEEFNEAAARKRHEVASIFSFQHRENRRVDDQHSAKHEGYAHRKLFTSH